MKFKTVITFLILLLHLVGRAQTNLDPSSSDSSITKKITISGFCLCKTTLTELKNLSNDFKVAEVEEMDLPKNCISRDARFENGKGYYSKKYPGMIFQKDPNSDYISKIRLTKDFNGYLPDGTKVNLQKLTLMEVFKVYPGLSNKWGSRGCSTFWNISNDTISFFVKIDPEKKPQYPVDEVYYSKKPVDAIDIKISCYSLFNRKKLKKLFNDPIFFIDSINVTRLEMNEYQPTDIAAVTVYKDTNAIKLVGPEGRDGVVYMETKKFARNKYWNFFKNRSAEYLKAFPTPETDSAAVYILNNKPLTSNFEGLLSSINDQNFIELKLIDKENLIKNYGVTNKSLGILIRANIETSGYKPR